MNTPPILAHNFRYDPEIFFRRRDESADALNRFRDKRRDAPRCGGADQVFHIVRASHVAGRILEPQRTAVAIGVQCMDKPRDRRAAQASSCPTPVAAIASAERP